MRTNKLLPKGLRYRKAQFKRTCSQCKQVYRVSGSIDSIIICPGCGMSAVWSWTEIISEEKNSLLKSIERVDRYPISSLNIKELAFSYEYYTSAAAEVDIVKTAVWLFEDGSTFTPLLSGSRGNGHDGVSHHDATESIMTQLEKALTGKTVKAVAVVRRIYDDRYNKREYSCALYSS